MQTIHLILYKILRDRCYQQPHFTDEETEQRSGSVVPQGHIAEPDSNLHSLALDPVRLVTTLCCSPGRWLLNELKQIR